jgi:hypothetical protein
MSINKRLERTRHQRKRATESASNILDLGRPDTWNWRAVSEISSRINREIRRLAVTKAGTRVVLWGKR